MHNIKQGRENGRIFGDQRGMFVSDRIAETHRRRNLLHHQIGCGSEIKSVGAMLQAIPG
jgi:hypothetical protein